MGGLGSGNWGRAVNAKLTIDFHRIHVREIVRASGELAAASDTGYRWSYLCEKNGLVLLSPDDETFGAWIPFTFTPCRFGGHKKWFLCPNCNSRRAVLYASHHLGWACRACLSLRYPSQYGSCANRLLNRTQRLQTKLAATLRQRQDKNKLRALSNELVRICGEALNEAEKLNMEKS